MGQQYSLDSPNIFGPALWTTLHTLALTYPTQPDQATQDSMRSFLTSLQTLLPCPECRKHYVAHMTANDVQGALHNKDALHHWVVDLHNSVSRRLMKPEWNADKVAHHYSYAYPHHHVKMHYAAGGAFVAVVVLIALAWLAGLHKRKSSGIV